MDTAASALKIEARMLLPVSNKMKTKHSFPLLHAFPLPFPQKLTLSKGVVTTEFLDFSASRGNDLRSIPGMRDGCKWCLCVNRWKEAMEARKDDDDPVVPKVFLHATDEKALEGLSLGDLKKVG